MRTLVFMLLLFFSFPLFSKVLKIENSNNQKTIFYDYNLDQKVDLIEYYKDNILVKSQRDEDFDGLMDITTEYFFLDDKKLPFEIHTKKDRVTKFYRNTLIQRIIKTTEIDQDGDGKYELKITDHYPITQESEHCFTPVLGVSSVFDELNAVINNTVTKMGEGFVIGDYGHKIHQSCLNHYQRPDFKTMLSNSIKIGLACFEDLAKKNTIDNPKAPNGALVNLEHLKKIMKQTPVTIVCHEKDYDWDGTAGHASTQALDEIKSLGVKHPYISLSPMNSDNGKTLDEEDSLELEKTIFHEQLHNLGYRHGADVEFPYACEACCFDKPNEARAAACQICRGQYSHKKGVDRKYITDLVNWSEKNHGGIETEKVIITYMKENPSDRWGLVMLARGNAGIFSPVGIEMAKMIKSSNAEFSAEEKESLDQALMYSDVITIKKASSNAKLIAVAYQDYYFSNDPTKAMTLLNSKKSTLKKIKKEAANIKLRDEEMYTNQKIFNDAKSILSDIWLKNYPDHKGPESDMAYALLLELDAL